MKARGRSTFCFPVKDAQSRNGHRQRQIAVGASFGDGLYVGTANQHAGTGSVCDGWDEHVLNLPGDYYGNYRVTCYYQNKALILYQLQFQYGHTPNPTRKKETKKKAAAKLTRETEQEGRAQATASSQSHSGREGWHPMHRRRIPRKPTPQPIDSLTSILRPNSNSNSNRIPLATSILWGAPPNAHVALLCCRRRPLASTA